MGASLSDLRSPAMAEIANLCVACLNPIMGRWKIDHPKEGVLRLMSHGELFADDKFS